MVGGTQWPLEQGVELPLSYSQSQIENAFEHQEGADGLAGVWLAAAPWHVMGVVEPVVHDIRINPAHVGRETCCIETCG